MAIDSDYEPVTAAVAKYRNDVLYPKLSGTSLILRRKQSKMARRIYTAPACAQPDVVMITGVGHGLEDRFTGDQGEILLKTGEYAAAEVSGKMIHFTACRTAARLGPDCVTNGAKAYFGYDIDFTYIFGHEQVFFECDSEIDLAIADGLDAGKVFQRIEKLFRKRITELEAAGSIYVAQTLATDLDHLMGPHRDAMWGSTQASISSPTTPTGTSVGQPPAVLPAPQQAPAPLPPTFAKSPAANTDNLPAEQILALKAGSTSSPHARCVSLSAMS